MSSKTYTVTFNQQQLDAVKNAIDIEVDVRHDCVTEDLWFNPAERKSITYTELMDRKKLVEENINKLLVVVRLQEHFKTFV
jgi:hypothetical protein